MTAPFEQPVFRLDQTLALLGSRLEAARQASSAAMISAHFELRDDLREAWSRGIPRAVNCNEAFGACIPLEKGETR